MKDFRIYIEECPAALKGLVSEVIRSRRAREKKIFSQEKNYSVSEMYVRKSLTLKKKTLLGLFVGLVIFVSRFFFFDGTPDYFDATQYLWRTDSGTLLDALSTGHAPHHPGYIFFSYYFHNILQFFHVNNLQIATTLPAVIFGSLALWFFYLLSLRLTKNYLAATAATLLATFAPYFWLGSVSILIDPVMWCGYLAGLYYWLRYLETKNIWFSFWAGLGLAWAIFAHTQVGIWVVAYIVFFFAYTKPKQYIWEAIKALPFVIPIIAIIAAYVYILLHTHHNDSAGAALKYLLLGNAGDHSPFTVVNALRMTIIQISMLGLFVGGLSFIYVWAKNKRLAVALTGWLLPGAIMAPAYLYANLHGRALALGTLSIFIAIGFAFAKLYQIKKYRPIATIIFSLLILQLIAVSAPSVWKMRTDISPYRELEFDIKSLKQPGLQIINNASKTYNEFNKYLVVWESPRDKIDAAINETIAKGEPIYVGLDAIVFPFFRYDGVVWDITSTGFGNPGDQEPNGKWLFDRFNFDITYWSKKGYKSGEYELSEQDKPFSERVLASLNNIPPGQTLIALNLQNEGQPQKGSLIDIYSANNLISPQRINKNDPLQSLWWKSNNIQDPVLFSLTDKSGLMQIAVPTKEARDLLFYATTYPNTFVGSGQIKFYQKQTRKVLTDFASASGDKNKLAEAIGRFDGKQFAVTIEKNGAGYKWQIGAIKTETPFELSGAINFSSLLRQIGREENGEIVASAGDGTGFMSFGPWIELPAGKYKAKIKIKTNQDTPFEVSANGPKTLAQENINTNNEWKEVEVGWQTTENSGGVEFRATHLPGADVALDNIKLEYLK